MAAFHSGFDGMSFLYFNTSCITIAFYLFVLLFYLEDENFSVKAGEWMHNEGLKIIFLCSHCLGEGQMDLSGRQLLSSGYQVIILLEIKNTYFKWFVESNSLAEMTFNYQNI